MTVFQNESQVYEKKEAKVKQKLEEFRAENISYRTRLDLRQTIKYFSRTRLLSLQLSKFSDIAC